eukprot:5985917-Pleurochrysis_carterae.AAC.1
MAVNSLSRKEHFGQEKWGLLGNLFWAVFASSMKRARPGSSCIIESALFASFWIGWWPLPLGLFRFLAVEVIRPARSSGKRFAIPKG